MQTYELFLTNKCTRNCVFCDIPKGNYKATQNDVCFFIDYVKAHQQKTSQFKINFFGGEPLICINHIYDVCKSFKEYSFCEFNLVTNGDLLKNVDINKFPKNLKLAISAYDIFDDVGKYEMLLNKFSYFNPQLQFTFDENTLGRVNQFIDICKKINAKYKIAFSHASKSWKTISNEDLNEFLNAFYTNQFNSFYEQSDFNCPQTINTQLNQLIQLIINPNMKENYCISHDKKTFFEGKMIGSCIRHMNYEVKCPTRCKDCKFRVCCQKSCVAEYINGEIDEKLCLLLKIPFEIITKCILHHINENRMKQIINYFINKMICN